MKPLVAIDYDDTWSSSPKLFAAIGKAIRKAGGSVVIVTGNPDAQSDLKGGKKSKSYDDVVVIKHADDEADTAAGKEAWLAENKADLLIDNNVANCLAATRVCDAALFFPKQRKLEKKSSPLLKTIRALARDCQ